MLHERFVEHARGRAQSGAVVCAGEEIDYRTLERRSRCIASFLRERGIGRGDLVAVMLPRSVDVVVAMMGILRSGAAYTVVEDEQQASKRVVEQLRRARADAVLTTRSEASSLSDEGIVAVESTCAEAAEPTLEPVDVMPDDVAYVVFTSGSTGRPKGVAVTHANVCHYVDAIARRLEVHDPISCAHVSALSADLGNTSLFLALWTGGVLHLVDDATRKDGEALLRYLVQQEVNLLKITPSHWRAVFRPERGAPRGLRLQRLVLGGEALPAALAREALELGVAETLVNHYGPTEATIGAAAFCVRQPEDVPCGATPCVPIGRPLGATSVLVRTCEGEYRMVGAEGELYIAGPGVAAGYRNDPAATRAAFVPVDGVGRCYRTGDRVRIDADGVLHFLGRIDRQVKVAGRRVDLEDVERSIVSVNGVERAVACLVGRESNERLVAALSPARDPALPTRVRDRLRQTLPDYMVPGRIVAFQDLPRNSNGKTDVSMVRALLEDRLRRPHAAPAESQEFEDDRERDVTMAWRRYLGHDEFDVDASFFDVGGTSLDAIQVVSELQVLGYEVTAAAFLEEPTVRSLSTRIGRRAATQPARREGHRARRGPLSPAQEEFFSRRFDDPAYWNQALLVRSTRPLNLAILEDVVSELMRIHPLLRTAFRCESGTTEARLVERRAKEVLSWSRCDEFDDAAMRVHVEGEARRLHELIDPGKGDVFRAHVFSLAGRFDHLLLISHHLCVDAVSWRILVDDLTRLYADRAEGRAPNLPNTAATFWDWVDDVNDHFDDLTRDLPDTPPERSSPAESRRTDNLEGSAVSVWLALSRAETSMLRTSARTRLHVPEQAMLLGAFVVALTRRRECAAEGSVTVDIESHGRLSPSPEIDVSRIVGWFTSTFPLTVEASRDPHDAVRAVAEQLDAVPHLGLGHALRRRYRRNGDGSRACYNYLGDFRFAARGDFGFEIARHPIGPARGSRNDRFHDLKLTARILRGQLVVDLSFGSSRHRTHDMVEVLSECHVALRELIGLPSTSRHAMLVEDGSSAGLVSYAPPSLPLSEDALRAPRRRYGSVLLTGATGFVGAHVLRELLSETDARVFCLVRGQSSRAAEERLRSAYEWYFADEFAEHTDRVTVLVGDAAHERLGLDAGLYGDLVEEVDAVYNFAADTRLFGEAEHFRGPNTDAVRTLIEMARTGRRKDLHHMSTLAVAGRNPLSRSVVFSENTLDIGQEFYNEYERSKYRAEVLVRRHVAAGGTAYVYRSGDVFAHSGTGIYSRHAGDNRFVHLLRAVVRLGRVPRRLNEALVLSQVDVVARGIVKLSLEAETPAGTYHVESDKSIDFRDIVTAVRDLGIPLEACAAESFAQLLEPRVTSDADVALAYFWAARPPRNVRYDHRLTHALLRRLECDFPRPDRPWLRRVLSRLVQQEVLVE